MSVKITDTIGEEPSRIGSKEWNSWADQVYTAALELGRDRVRDTEILEDKKPRAEKRIRNEYDEHCRRESAAWRFV